MPSQSQSANARSNADIRNADVCTPDSDSEEPNGAEPDFIGQGDIASLAGIFAGEPLWDELMREVQALRDEQDAAEAGKA